MLKEKPQKKNKKEINLSKSIHKMIFSVGAILISISVCIFIIAGYSDYEFTTILAGIGVLIFGFLVIGFAEVLNLLIKIERNTRKQP